MSQTNKYGNPTGRDTQHLYRGRSKRQTPNGGYQDVGAIRTPERRRGGHM